MGVAVYPQLAKLLRVRNLTVAELERQIERRYGITVDPKTLYRLTSEQPVQRADLEIIGAAAAVLGVGLGDIFEIEAVPVFPDGAEGQDLGPEESRRLSELFDQQGRRALSSAEQVELERLVDEYGRHRHERRLRELAARRGISVDQARYETEAQLQDALGWWRSVESDSEWRRKVAAQAGRRKQRSAE